MRQIISNVSWMTVERLSSVILLVFLEGYLARVLSVEVYGRYQYFLNLSLIITVLLNVIPGEVVIPRLSRNKKLAWGVINVVFLYRVLITFVFVGLYIFLHLVGLNEYDSVAIFTISLLLTEASSVVVNYFQSIVVMKYVSFIRLMVLSFRTTAILSLSTALLDITTIAWIRFLESLILGGFLFYLIMGAPTINKKLKCVNKISKVILENGIRVWPSIIIYYLLIRLDRVAVGHFFDMSKVAYYAVAQQVVDQVTVLLVIVAGSILPVFVYKRRVYKNKVQGFVKSLIGLFSLSIIFLIVTLIASKYFIFYVYGESYIASTYILNVMIWILPLSILDYSFTQFFISINKMYFVVLKNVSGLFIGFSLYYLFAEKLTIIQFPIILIGVNVFLVLISLVIMVLNHAKNKRHY